MGFTAIASEGAPAGTQVRHICIRQHPVGKNRARKAMRKLRTGLSHTGGASGSGSAEVQFPGP